MSNVTGVIDAIGTKSVKTKFGMKNVYSIKVDGEWYKCGFKQPRADKGDEVSFNYTEGTYGKEIAEEVVGSGSVPKSVAREAPVAARPRGGFPIPALDGQRAIVRQNSVTNAVNLLRETFDKSVPFAARADVIILTARMFEAYSCGQLDEAMAAKMTAKKKPSIEEVLSEEEAE